MNAITSGVISTVKWGKEKLAVRIEREGGQIYTIGHFDLHERALAEEMYQEALHTHADDFAALWERFSALRAGAPKALSGGAKQPSTTPAESVNKTQITRKELKHLIDEAEKVGRGKKALEQRMAEIGALLRKAEVAHDKAWAKVAEAIEALKQS